MKEIDSSALSNPNKGALRPVPISWDALEDAFENNAPEVHSYLQLDSGEVMRVVDGVADPTLYQRITTDENYLRIEPVSSREQYRWMERFVVTVEDPECHKKLMAAMDGKGAFRRFKDALMSYAVERERWFAFRSERLRGNMVAWLEAHGLQAIQKPDWKVPTPEEVKPVIERKESEHPQRKNRALLVEATRKKLHDLVDQLAVRELDAAAAFLEFLRERKHVPRVQVHQVHESTPKPAHVESQEEEHPETLESHSFQSTPPSV